MREPFLVFLLGALLGYSSGVTSFLLQNARQSSRAVPRIAQVNVKAGGGPDGADEGASARSTASDRPLYDGTNYTFPDTRTPNGIAQLLEVTFVHGCMQLARGYVDVLKMFIAASVASYEYGFPLSSIEEELEACKSSTANRPLMAEEVTLRRNWYSLVYLTLVSMGHTTAAQGALVESVPQDIRDVYGEMVEQVGLAYQRGTASSLSVDGLLNSYTGTSSLPALERAILSQSLRVAVLTPVVVRESAEARGGDVQPPPPPIEGAFL
jgi:hypothetical protein